MDYYYLMLGFGVMAISSFVQIYVSGRWRTMIWMLPFVYGALTFWLGLISLLFGFALIILGEFVSAPHRRDSIDGFLDQ